MEIYEYNNLRQNPIGTIVPFYSPADTQEYGPWNGESCSGFISISVVNEGSTHLYQAAIIAFRREDYLHPEIAINNIQTYDGNPGVLGNWYYPAMKTVGGDPVITGSGLVPVNGSNNIYPIVVTGGPVDIQDIQVGDTLMILMDLQGDNNVSVRGAFCLFAEVPDSGVGQRVLIEIKDTVNNDNSDVYVECLSTTASSVELEFSTNDPGGLISAKIIKIYKLPK